MGETRKIVIPQYPVEKLPEEIRSLIEGATLAGSAPAQTVTLTVEQSVADDEAVPEQQSWMSFVGSASGVYSSPEEVVDFIRSLRDESER